MKSSYCPSRRCISCGRFMSYDDLGEAVWHNFTSIMDMEPREDEPEHKACNDDYKARMAKLQASRQEVTA